MSLWQVLKVTELFQRIPDNHVRLLESVRSAYQGFTYPLEKARLSDR